MAARWVRIRFLRHIPGEILRELKWLAGDIFYATRRGKIFSLLYQILRFRYEKTVGTVTGIMDSRGIASPARRAAILFDTEFPAVVIRGPHHASLERKTIPGLQPGEVLVRVSHVGICATDLEILEGSLGYYKSGMAKYPIVPGHELSGTIVSLGPGVTGFYEGDRVVVECIQGCGECKECQSDSAIRCQQRREVGVIGQDGGYAAYVVTRARYAHEIPDDLPLSKAALCEPMAVVMKGLRRIPGGVGSPPRKVAVVGAGAIGHLTARVLAARGHTVTVFDRNESRLAHLNGAVATSKEIDSLDGFEWIVEATGDQNALMTVLEKSATGATLLLMGLPYAKQPFSFESIVGFDRTVVGSVGSSSADFEEAIAMLRTLDTTPFLQTTFPLHEFENAWAAVRTRTPLKVMLWVDAMPAAAS
jgi:2-desacetyl-2-hydroxyethyl bacteriochlorophyllide A dehydrogenase